jgi:hypothetical protein
MIDTRTFCQHKRVLYMKLHHHHHRHISVMQLGHLLTRSGLTDPEVSSKVCHNSFCQLENSVSLRWVVYYEAFCLHVVFFPHSYAIHLKVFKSYKYILFE